MTSVRGRVFAALAATAVVCTVLTVVVASVVLQRQQRERRTQAIGRVADAAGATLAQQAPAPADGGVRVVRLTAINRGVGRSPRGAARQRLLDAIDTSHAPRTGFAHVGDQTLAYAVRDEPAGRLLLIAPSGVRTVQQPAPGRTVVVAGLAGLLVALGLGWLLTRRLTSPVRAVADAAGALASGRDVTVPVTGADEFRALATAFNAMSDDLARARDRERAFLASVSHELKTPLTTVRGYAEAITDDAIDPQQAAAVIGQESARLERLVGDLLDLARLQRRDFASERTGIDLAAIANQAVERHRLRAQQLDVHLDAVTDAPAHGIGDPDRAVQVVSNLIENAIRVAPAGGAVHVTACTSRLEVSDDGPGIEPADLPHAFERFYLHDRLRSDRPVGSGLGLALVRELVDGMGGSVDVTSTPGAGTTFTVVLDGAREHGAHRSRSD